MLANAVALVSSKGGVGKTSVATNVAGRAARSGWRVLLVDLDAQGSASRDLGYVDASGDGKALLQAVVGGMPPAPMRDVRPGLDVLAGGVELQRLEDVRVADVMRGRGTCSLETGLAGIAGDDDLVLLHCPTSVGRQLVVEALRTAGFALIPTRVDDASIDGLAGLARQAAQLRDDPSGRANPCLEVLGVVLFDVDAGHAALRRETRRELAGLLEGIAPVLESVVRSSARGARDVRAGGLLAHEYGQEVIGALPWHEARRRGVEPPCLAANADGLAGDCAALTSEVLRRVAERREARQR